jgi:hypothetical protein
MEQQLKEFALQSLALGFIGGVVGASFVGYACAKSPAGSNSILTVQELHVVDRDGSDQIRLTAGNQGPTLVLVDKDKHNFVKLFVANAKTIQDRKWGLSMGEIGRNPDQVTLMSGGRDFSFLRMSASNVGQLVSLAMSPMAERSQVDMIPDASFLLGNLKDGFFLAHAGYKFALTEVHSAEKRLKTINRADQPVRIVDVTQEYGQDKSERPVIFGPSTPIDHK